MPSRSPRWTGRGRGLRGRRDVVGLGWLLRRRLRSVRFRRVAWSGRRQRRLDDRGLGACSRNRPRLGLHSGRRFPGIVRADGRWNVDVCGTAVGRFHGARPEIPSSAPVQRPRAAGARQTPRLARRESAPASTGRGETLEDLSCSGVDDEALIAGGAGADVGEIDAWPPHERPVNTYPCASRLRSTSPRGPPGRQPLSYCGGTEAKMTSPSSAETAIERRSVHST